METRVLPKDLIPKIGQQYLGDKRLDSSGFLAKARLHMSVFRAKNGYDYDRYGNYLTKEERKQGKNFFNGLPIFEYARDIRYPQKDMENMSDKVYGNMLRSEHIPLNFFVPFIEDKDFCKRVMSRLTGEPIDSIEKVEIEHGEKYLKDLTAFDTYIEYTSKGLKCAYGIEVKFTEREYALTGVKQTREIMDKSSLYYTETLASMLYTQKAKDDLMADGDVQEPQKLSCDLLRQIWRNHLLGDCMQRYGKVDKFTSLLFYPQDNVHFHGKANEKGAIETYQALLNDSSTFRGITFEKFFHAIEDCLEYHEDKELYGDWLNYLRERYIVIDWKV